MFRILHDTKYDFIRWWRVAAGLTIAFIAVGLIALAAERGFNYSVDFTGGTIVQLNFTQPPDVAKLRAAIEAGGAKDPNIQQFGTATAYIVRVQGDTSSSGTERAAQEVQTAVASVVGADGFKVDRYEAVGPRVGAELRRGAIIAILVSFGITLIYLAWRFEWRFGLAAVCATAHDILATIAFVAMLRLEVSLTVIAALLTVIGYSLNDTIIIFDRVRENLRRNRKESLYDTLNRSVNETLPRSVLTHATTLAATLALLFFAGEVIRPFAWVMAFGIFTGTFSSIYVASPILMYVEQRFPRDPESKGARSGAAAKAATAR
ncbi:MAG TPA: protein translocase subunit SecF [Gemmatimonadaceae bacterium]|nr:protein translocase subunit SecF [Gemmatimonadaceae bacterium]